MTDLQLPNSILGVSVSDSPDLVGRGLGEIHVRHALVEIVRHIFAAGGTVAYGGDLRPGGYTDALFDLVRAYSRNNRPDPERLLNYSAWPIWTEFDASIRASIGDVATLIRIERPRNAPIESDEFIRALALTDMRNRMNNDISARLVLGGRTAGQHGLLPGVVEETVLAIQAGKPVFAIGGFGGAGQLVIDAMAGRPRPELSIEYQLEHSSNYVELLQVARAHDLTPDFSLVNETLASAAWPRVSNGLEPKENERLARTADVNEIVALVLIGLRRVEEESRRGDA